MLMIFEKITGITCVISGAGGMIFYILFRQKQKIQQLAAVKELLHDAIWCMEMKKSNMKDFFEEQSQKGEMTKRRFCLNMYKNLKQHMYPTGEKAWEMELTSMRKEWILDSWEFEMIRQSGKYLFGPNRHENMEALKAVELEILHAQQREKDVFIKRQKVTIPVGMMLGVGIVIIFL